jgi:hypothetical protein
MPCPGAWLPWRLRPVIAAYCTYSADRQGLQRVEPRHLELGHSMTGVGGQAVLPGVRYRKLSLKLIKMTSGRRQGSGARPFT